MANQERGARRGIFRMATQTREAPPPILPEQKPPKTKKPLIQRLAQNLAVRIALGGLALAGAGGYGAYRIVESNNTQPPPAEETISKENIIQLTRSSFTPVSPEQELELWRSTKTVDLENHTFTIGFPVDQATIDKSPNLRIDQQFDAILPPFIDANQLKQKGVKNLENMSGLPQGAEYKIRYDDTKFDASVILLSTAGITKTIGSNSFTPAYSSYLLLLRDKESGKSNLGQVISGLYAKPLIQTEPYPTQVSPVYENGTPVKSGDSILRLTTDLQAWDGKIGQPLPGQRGQFVVRSSYEQENPRAPIPLTKVFLHSSDANIAVTK